MAQFSSQPANRITISSANDAKIMLNHSSNMGCIMIDYVLDNPQSLGEPYCRVNVFVIPKISSRFKFYIKQGVQPQAACRFWNLQHRGWHQHQWTVNIHENHRDRFLIPRRVGGKALAHFKYHSFHRE